MKELSLTYFFRINSGNRLPQGYRRIYELFGQTLAKVRAFVEELLSNARPLSIDHFKVSNEHMHIVREMIALFVIEFSHFRSIRLLSLYEGLLFRCQNSLCLKQRNRKEFQISSAFKYNQVAIEPSPTEY